jgi:flagellar hook assembly protein FlgD
MIWNSNYADEVVYPNPFQQQTIIEFTLKNPDAVTLDIIDVNGKLVRRLMDNETLNNGKFQVMWDGKNFNQVDMSNGTYWYVLKNKNGENKSGKIALVK